MDDEGLDVAEHGYVRRSRVFTDRWLATTRVDSGGTTPTTDSV
jgi:hypothetical protein